MLFGNDSWMTGKEMDSPSGWQFAARAAWTCACSKSGCCQEWLSPEFEPNSSRKREDSAPLFCADTTLTTLCLAASDAATAFKTCRKNKNKKKKKFSRDLFSEKRSSLPPCARLLFFNIWFYFVYQHQSQSVLSAPPPSRVRKKQNKTKVWVITRIRSPLIWRNSWLCGPILASWVILAF